MKTSSCSLGNVATKLLDAGLSVLPARSDQKFATVRWKPYQSRLPTACEIEAWFANGPDAICLVTGAVSGNLETIDFDLAGEAFEPWCDLVRDAKPGLLERLVIEKTPSGGRHISYRCESEISGNLKLAQRKQILPGSDPIVIHGKEYIPRRDADGEWCVLLTLIETRGNGGLFLCAPSTGYELVQGEFTALPVLTTEERESLLEAAWALNEFVPEPVNVPAAARSPDELRPGDDFNARGDLRALLLKHSWTLAKSGENEYWRRPGKSHGWSASLKDRVFFVFSSNAAPFEPNQAYSPFAVCALLDHQGDFHEAGCTLRREGFGDESLSSPDIDLSGIVGDSQNIERDDVVALTDPGPLPEELLRVPGFISEVMDHCLATAPYPNVALAFCGALALQAFLAGRKVRDEADNRTNIYLLALAFSAVGKDWPRKVNTAILHRVGLVNALGEKFASGEGIQDSLFINPSLLFQTDEIDGLLQSINKSRDARHENILGTLLTMYSSANSIYPMRRKAGKEPPGVIDQPCLVVYGTAIPTHYYSALSERMLTNGFFARMLIVESGRRSVGQDPGIIDPPAQVIETAQWWADFCPGSGNLENWHPQPKVVPATQSARQLLTDSRLQAESEYAKSESRDDPVGTTVWGRVHEQTRKLALLYGISENHVEPVITEDAVRWASEFVTHQTRRMLFMAHGHVADNPFHSECLKLVKKLRDAPQQTLPHSVLLKRMKMDAKTFHGVIETLAQQGDIEIQSVKTTGRTGIHYRLLWEGSIDGERKDARSAGTRRETSTDLNQEGE